MAVTTKCRTLTTLLRHATRQLCTTPKRNPKLVNFSLPSDSDTEPELPPPTTTKKPNLPPPYDPFNKKPVIQDATDPNNLQEVFHRIRTDGCFESAVKMFDGLSKEGLTCEALELFGEVRDKGCVPDVVAHTAVLEAYVDAGKAKDALKVFLRMLAAGVLPNAYTYGVLIKGLSADGKMLGEAKKYAMEMMEKGMKPNAETTVSVLEGFVREGKADEGREFMAEMKKRRFLPDKNAVREILKKTRGPESSSVMNMIFDL